MRNVHNPNDCSDLPIFGGAPIAQPSYVSEAAAKARDEAIAALRKQSGEEFIRAASMFVLEHLRAHGPATGEQLTDACKAAGIMPANDKAFGPIYAGLARAGRIGRHGYAPRNRGHGAPGIVWRAVETRRG